jgi:RHS repeat-associated protein
MIGSSAGISNNGFGMSFGTGLSYDSLGSAGSSGFGANWISGELAGLSFAGGEVYYRTGPMSTILFKPGSSPGSYTAAYFVRDVLTRNTSTGAYTLLKSSGSREFFDSSGRMTGFSDAGGATGSYNYNGDGLLESVAASSGGQSWEYAYVWSGGNVTEITYKVNGRATLKTVYGYSSGRLETIRTYQNSASGTGPPEWGGYPVEAARYSYHASGLLRHVVPSPEYKQMLVNGIDPATATMAQLNEYAETEYEYGAGNRVSKMLTHGRRYEHNFTYTTGWLSGNTFNTWRMKTEVARSGDTVETFFLNGVGQVILKRMEQKNSAGEVLETWYPVYQKFEEDGGARIVLAAEASAIDASSFSESKPALVDLKTDEGLVTEYIYNSQGLPDYTQQRMGTAGATARLSQFTYVTQPVSGVGTVQRVATETIFRNENATEALTTSYEYEWHTDTLQPSKVTRILPVVEVAENGTGVAARTEEYYDLHGFLTKSVDAAGTATTYDYDKVQSGMIQEIQDQGSGRLNLQTDYELDDLGRTIRELGPLHTIDIGGVAIAIRSARWTYYKDGADETWSFGGYLRASDSSVHCVGAVRIARANVVGSRPTGKSGWRMDDEIAADFTGSGIPLGTATFESLFPRTTWQSWKINLIDTSSELREEWTYWQIPAIGFGAVDVDYGARLLNYDAAGRLNETTCAGGTTDRTTFNAMDWPVQEELGVNADPATYTVTRINEYDDDGNLRKAILPVDATSEHNRVTEYRYDWRNRRTETETTVERDSSEGSGEWTLIKKVSYENRDLVIAETIYHSGETSDPATNRIAYSETDYDAVGMSYRSRVYAVAPDGNISKPQTSNRYYDRSGRVMKDAPSGSQLFSAVEYDALGRVAVAYRAYDAVSSSSSSLSSSASSGQSPYVIEAIVMEQVENYYDDAGNTTSAVSRQRYDDATGTGPLQGSTTQPKARLSYQASYPDALGRVQATVNYGTNGGGAWTRASVIPVRSADVQIDSYDYDGLGRTSVETDPAGIRTCRNWDKAGRLIELVENCPGASSSSSSSSSSSGTGPVDVRTTRYEYTSDGWLKKLISENNATGQQATEWVYGVDPSKGSALSSKRLVYRKFFPEAANPVTYTYNRQLQPTGTTDQLGTVHAYAYDKLGRLLADTVGAFGTGVDNTVGKLGTGYGNRGLPIRSTSYNTAGTGVLNEIAWEYNDFNQAVAEYQEHAGAVTKSTSLKVGYVYANGLANTIRPTGIKYPHAGSASALVVTAAYTGTMADSLSRIDEISDGSNVLSSWRCVGLSMVVAQKYDGAASAELTYGNSGNDYNGYDRFGAITATLWKSGSTVLVDSLYGRNAVGGTVWRKDVKAHALSVNTQDNYYWYDGLRQVRRHDQGELTPSTPPYTGITTLQQQENLTYDQTGNWQGYQSYAPSLVQGRTHNEANQIDAVTGPAGVVQPDYDAVGNMTAMPAPSDWTQAYDCKWDAWNRLVEIKDGSTVVGSYTYDAKTRRIRKTAGGETRDCYYDRQWRALEERVSGNVKADYVWNPSDRWNLIRRRRSVSGSLDETRYVLRDYLDPVAIIDASATVIERYGYDAFGPVRIMDAGFAARSSSACAWVFLFHCEFLDAESGLYNYGYRYYHPQLGRWISRDPIGEMNGSKLYPIASNDCINRLDVYGLYDLTLPTLSFSTGQTVTFKGCMPLMGPVFLCLSGGWNIQVGNCCDQYGVVKGYFRFREDVAVTVEVGSVRPFSVSYRKPVVENLAKCPSAGCNVAWNVRFGIRIGPFYVDCRYSRRLFGATDAGRWTCSGQLSFTNFGDMNVNAFAGGGVSGSCVKLQQPIFGS